ncbi:hypothetical protein ACFQ0B_30715 [Nonomuraea thailandensis]
MTCTILPRAAVHNHAPTSASLGLALETPTPNHAAAATRITAAAPAITAVARSPRSTPTLRPHPGLYD